MPAQLFSFAGQVDRCYFPGIHIVLAEAAFKFTIPSLLKYLGLKKLLAPAVRDFGPRAADAATFGLAGVIVRNPVGSKVIRHIQWAPVGNRDEPPPPARFLLGRAKMPGSETGVG